MGSNFKDLDARNPTVKTVRDLDVWFKRQNFLNKRNYETKKKLPSCDKWRTCSVPLIATWGAGSDFYNEYSSTTAFDIIE